MANLIDILTEATVKTEGLLPGQTPLRITNESMRKWNTVQGVPIDKKANIPSNRKNFFFVEPGKESEVIRRQWKSYFKNKERFGLSDDSTLTDVINKFDQENPKNKIEILKQKGINVNDKIKSLKEKFDLSELNPFSVKEAEAGENRNDRVVKGLFPEQSPTIQGFGEQLATGLINSAAGGFPLYLEGKIKGEQAVKDRESQAPLERFGRGLGTTLGTVLPGSIAAKAGIKAVQLGGKVILGADKFSKINRFAKSAAEGATSFGIYEAGTAPEKDYKEKIVSVPTSALFGAALGTGSAFVEPKIKSFLIKKGLLQNDKISGTPELSKLNSILEAGDKAKNVQEPLKVKIKSLAGKFEVEFIDRHSPLRHFEELVESNLGRRLSPKESLSSQIDRFLGTEGIIESLVTRYADDYKKVGANTNLLSQIKVAQRLQERSYLGFENPQKTTLEEAQKMLQDLGNSVGKEEFNNALQVAEQHRRLLRRLLFRAKESGLIDGDSFKNMTTKNQYYTPFRVLDYMVENADNISKGGGFKTSLSGALKATEGTTRDIQNPIDSEINYITKLAASIEKNNVKKKFFDLADINTTTQEYVQPIKEGIKSVDIPKGFKRVNVYRNGVKEEYAVEENIANVLNGLNEKTMDLMTKFASHFSGALRLGATSANIAFTLPNLFRDFQLANLVMATHGINFNPIDLVKGLSSALKKDTFYKLWQSRGGSHSGLQNILRRSGARQTLSPSLSERIGDSVNPIKFLSKVSEISETSTRLGVFKKALQTGIPIEQAVTLARNATIDFARMGNTMQIANLWTPFLSARVGGLRTTLEAFKRNPKKALTSTTGMIQLPQIMTQLHNMTNYPDVWKDLRDFEKENNFLLIYGREKDEKEKYTSIAKIPKGDIGKLMGNPIQDFIEFLSGNDPDFMNTAFKVLASLSPVDFEREGKFSGEEMLSSLLPPPIKVAVESTTNRNLYTGRQVVPRRFEKAKPSEQFDEETSAFAVQVGKLVNVSPFKVENAFGTLLGGLGRQMIDPLRSGEILSRKFTGALGEQDQERQFNILEGIIQETETEKVKDYRLAKDALSQWRTLPPAPDIRRNFILETFRGNSKALKDFFDMVESEAKGEQPVHRLLKSMSVKDRFRFISEESLNYDTDEEKLLFLQDIIRNKVITPQSFKRIKE